MSWWIIIGFIIFLILSTLVTLFYLKKEWFVKEGFQTTNQPTQQIYLVSNANNTAMSYTDAEAACSVLGGRLAIATEVYNAAASGQNWSTPGWIGEDKVFGYCPVSEGNSIDGVYGPAIVRPGAETPIGRAANFYCDENYRNTGAGSAICYGILPRTRTGDYSIFPTEGTFEPLSISSNTNNGLVVSSIFDKTDIKTYTILDLDAINTQQHIIKVDIENMKKVDYENESQIINGKTESSSILSITDLQQKRIQVGYKLFNYHLDLLKNLSNFFVSVSFASNPLNLILQKFILANANNRKIEFNKYLFILLENINDYYNDIIVKMKSHPLAYLQSGVLNRANYLNSFGLTTLRTGTWDKPAFWYYKTNGTEIRKERVPPFPGCGSRSYSKSKDKQGNRYETGTVDRDDNKNSLDYHCPGGKWWHDRKEISNGNIPGYVYTPIFVGMVLQYPALDQTITTRDVNLIQLSSRTQNYYDTTFLSKSDGWNPKAYTLDAQPILTSFIDEKNRIATSYGISDTDKKNTYRWKPVNYIGTITDDNILEAKQSATISAIFNFTDYKTIEKQIRISSAPPFQLYYTQLFNAKNEYVQKRNPGESANNKDGEILASLEYASIALTIISIGVSSASAIRQAGSAVVKATSRTAQIGQAATGLGMLGATTTIAAGAAIAATAGSNTSANFTMSAANADYNDLVCKPFTAELFNLLPYQIREYIGFWALLRKKRILDWYITNVLTNTGIIKNSEGGPYEGSPKAKIKSDAWNKGANPGGINFTKGETTSVNDITIYDISSNFFNSLDEYKYKISESNTINSISNPLIRNKIYDAIAQSYYNLNNGEAYITKILDVYQVGKTLYDVRFTESRRSGKADFRNKIASLKSQHNTYRNMNLSESQLNNLESNFVSTTDALYEKEGKNLIDAASNCGVAAQIVKITNLTPNISFKLSQIIAINNYGQNVLYLKQPTASSTYLEPYETNIGKIYYDNDGRPYDEQESAKFAADDNKIIIDNKLSKLTDGTYTKRYDSFYKNESSDTNPNITIDSDSSFDISLVKLIHDNTMGGGRIKVELFNKDNISVAVNEIQCNSTESTSISFLREGRSADETPCPTDVYSYIKIGRFFATVDSAILVQARASPSGSPSGSPSVGSPLTFTGYAEGINAALTFNPLYNAGLITDTTSLSGNISYKPVTIFNRNTKENLNDCSEPARIRNIFKDHLINVNTSEFRDLFVPGSALATGREGAPRSALISQIYDVNYIYKPAVVTKAVNVSTDKYECAFVWKENIYDTENGSFTGNQIERYGIFNYKYDTENWLSRGVIRDTENTIQFSDLTSLQTYLQKTLSPVTPEVSLYLPYWDSVTLDNNGGRCPTTDCLDPSVINNIISKYNLYPNVSENDRILRVTKALTTAQNKCEYECITKTSLNYRVSFEVLAQINSNGVCSYEPAVFNAGNGLQPVIAPATYLNNDTPLLAKAYNYASDVIVPFVNYLSDIYSDLYNNYIEPQIDSYGDGIKGDLIRYRTTTNTAAGQIRHVSIIDQPVIDEYGNTCTTKCNSPEIIKSFYKYFNNKGDEKITSIQNVGMDTSGNCDFTYTTAPIIINNGSPQINSASGQTRGAKLKIARYINSCDYFVTGSHATIMPIPGMDSILNFSTIDVFNSPSGTSPITTAGVNSLAGSGTNPAVPITGPGTSGVPLLATGTPYLQNTLLENIDYIDCFSKYAMNSISQLGDLTGSITGVSQVDAKTCAIKSGITENHYNFGPNTSVVGVSAPLIPSGTVSRTTAFTAIQPVSFTTLVCNPAVSCDASSTKALTGFADSIVSSRTISSDTCEYKISNNNTLPFENTFERVGFYTGKSLTSLSGTDLHIKSISNATPATSPYSYFQNANIKPSFINDYMKLLQFLRYRWNEQFYSKTPTNTQTWKIGKISGIGVLVNEDALVIEAESSLYGLYGPYDIRDYNVKRYFKFTVRIDTLTGADANNYTVSPYTINNIRIYKSESSATSYGGYRSIPSGPPSDIFSVSDTQYNTICTFGGINYNTAWYDLLPTVSSGTQPTNAPQVPYVIQTVENSLKNGYYNRVRFTVNKSPMGTATQNSDARAEIARIMFYNLSTITTAGTATTGYVYQNIPNATVEIQDISSTYLLAQSGKNKCDKNFREIVDPETGIIECIYTGDIQQQYSGTAPCNTGDTEVSKVGDTYTCLPATVYTKPAGVACGIGYFGDTNGTKCNLIGDFYDVVQDPSIMFNTNSAVPRLRIPLGKYSLINFNKTVRIDGFSFLTGSAGTVPLQWNLEGSMNGENWRTIHCRSVDYNYSDAAPTRVNNTNIISFFTPGIFLINQDGASGSTCTVPVATTGARTTAGYSANNLMVYSSLAQNISEGFKAGEAPTLESIFKTPLLQNDIPSLKPVKANISTQKRILNFKFKILETYDPNSKFVHMSSLDFMSRSGRIPASLIKLSNLHGSRSSPKEGVNALLEGPQKRWVDYNKSDINIQISESAEPITGFRFSIPQGFPDSMKAMPIKWIMYGSYDKKSWQALHEFSGKSLPLINSFATVVFKLDEEI
jgi:hypothetical protein